MSNSNYNIELGALAYLNYDDGNRQVKFNFDPYNDCTDMDGLKEMAKTNWQEEYGEDMPDDAEVEIEDYGEIPEKWANNKDCWEFAEAYA